MNIEMTQQQYDLLMTVVNSRITDMEWSLSQKNALIDRLSIDNHRNLPREIDRKHDLTERIATMYDLQATLGYQGK